MSLADRLAAARLAQYPPDAAGTGGVRDSAGRDVTGRDVAGRSSGPLAEVRRQVHHDLLEAVGPELYDARLSQADLEQRVRQSLQEVLAPGSVPPLTAADRARLAQEIADDILGYGPIEPYLRDAEVTEIMVNGPGRIFVERGGPPVPGRRPVHRRAAPAPHDRQDRRPGGPPRRRGEPHGRRPSAGRQPRQRDHPAAGGRRLAADDPQVLRRPADDATTSSRSGP